ncbi:MAG: hypothetical protein ACXWLH_01300 [Candidatus Saccharimonadales bacterium]
MSFGKRIVDFLLFSAVAVLLIGGLINFAINFSRAGDDDSALIVKTLNPKRAIPKVRFIPAKVKTSRTADISNSILSPRAKKPVVINI